MVKLENVAAFLVMVAAACTTVPSYEGGHDRDSPHGIVQGEGEVILWSVDGKSSFEHFGENYVAPGSHALKFRVDYPMDDESQHPYEYVEYPLTIEAGHRYRVFLKGEQKGPPYTLDHKETKIRGYGAN